MSYTVGFDLGTHQTKICIQDATNPAEKIYEFLEFEKPNGETTVLFPSIVQINKDHTISYGFYDDDECLYTVPTEIEQPELDLMPLPKLEIPEFGQLNDIEYPERPKATKADIDNVESEFYTPLEDWVDICDNMNIQFIKEWKEIGLNSFRSYLVELKETLHRNILRMADYEVALEETKIMSQSHPLRFRYFKQAALTSPEIWSNEDFTCVEISIWYITYILLLLKQKLGEDFSVQFGVPCGASNTTRDRNITFNAYKLFISAYDLAEQFDSVDDYLLTTYEELKEMTVVKILSPTTIDEYIFDDIPEAFAGLVSVTKQKRLGMGFHLLVDIGGGTTDLALFTVTNGITPNIHSVSSIPFGLNYIFEMRQQDCDSPMELIQNDFFKHPTSRQFVSPVKSYKSILEKEGEKTWKSIIKTFSKSYVHHGMKMSRLLNALRLQPIIYCGGGSMFNNLHTPIADFTDIRRLNKGMLDIHNLKNGEHLNEDLYPILAISYGLASFEKDYDQKLEFVDLSRVFETFLPKAERNHYNDRYEHGLTDVE